jgi:hypothetical protein
LHLKILHLTNINENKKRPRALPGVQSNASYCEIQTQSQHSLNFEPRIIIQDNHTNNKGVIQVGNHCQSFQKKKGGGGVIQFYTGFHQTSTHPSYPDLLLFVPYFRLNDAFVGFLIILVFNKPIYPIMSE